MTVKERVTHELDQFNDDELQQVADYIAFLKFRTRRSGGHLMTDGEHLAGCYAAFAAEDRQLAEEGISAYADVLRKEDAQ
jgi:hypothetical protein